MFELLKRPLIKFCIGAAIIFGILYTRYVFFDFILSLTYYLKLNIPSIAYALLRIMVILCPLILLTPTARRIKRVTKLRVIYFIIGVCYLLGNTWIFYFLASNPVSSLLDINRLITEQYNNGLVLNYLVWNCYTLWGILFSTVQGVLYIILSKKIAEHRKPALKLNGLILLLAICIPFLYSLLDPALNNMDPGIRQQIYITSTMWIRKDIFILLSQIFIYLTLLLAGSSRHDWNDFLWLH